ncbi:Gfo/Idh/MocA family oxidoreductase [Nonomuraea sp. NPDC046802]|uniref:Gfo/Idh/MocA family protein n=1 Tax=Nonomuraea sp. NPDC046802 TaxID=3154919 RepID=UPI0033CDED42
MRFGVLGCADIAARRFLPALARVAGAEPVALASRSPSRARAFAERFGGAPVTGYQRLLERDDVDAVYVPLPAGLRAPWIERALLAGKHVFAEKALATGGEEVRRLVEPARAGKLTLMENFAFVHHRQHAVVRRLLAEGEIGEVHEFRAVFAVPPRPPGDIRLRPELGGGALLDVGVYPIRAALHFLGTNLKVSDAVLRYDDTLGVDVIGGTRLAAPDLDVRLLFGMTTRYASGYQFLGSRGSLTVEQVFTTPPEHRPVVLLERGGRLERRTVAPDDQWGNILRHFTDVVTGAAPVAEDASAGELLVRQAELADEVRAQGKPRSALSAPDGTAFHTPGR